MQLGDLERSSTGRVFLNTKFVPYVANLIPNGEDVLFVGIDTVWDYKPFFWNPSKQCRYFTMDIAGGMKPDIVANIEKCPEVTNNAFGLVIMIGMYEYLKNDEEAFTEIARIIKPQGHLLIAFPGDGYRADQKHVELKDIQGILKLFNVLELHGFYDKGGKASSYCVLAQKI